MPRLLIHFARFGPYHHARLRSAHEALGPLGWEVIGLEIAGNDATYAWDETKADGDGPKVVTAFPGRVFEELTASEYRRQLPPLLDAMMPDAIAIAGWGGIDARTCLSWCRKNHARAIVMSETRDADGRRVWWKELAKRHVISRFDGALVGGTSHRDYLVKLGMKAERVAFGYNVVDNEYFGEEALKVRRSEVRRQESEVRSRRSGAGDREPGSRSSFPLSEFPISAFPPKYFLASNRFIERKNLLRLTEAYAGYLESFQGSVYRVQDGEAKSAVPWGLCLLGDGEQKPALLAKCRDLGLHTIESAPWDPSSLKTENLNLKTHPHGVVWMPGFRQIEELPRFYAHAGCFIHPALEEPWGLVVNEAMACGLPVLSGDNVGAAESLVEDGTNGWTFDATDVEALSALMLRISAIDFPLSAFGDASRRLLEERASTSAFGRGLSALLGHHPTSH